MRRQIEQTFAALDSRILVEEPMSFAELRRAPLFPSGALAIVTGAFGIVVLILTVVGIYGTIGFAVAQRTHEIGVGMAFGARPRDILMRVVGGGAALILVGILVGITTSLAPCRCCTRCCSASHPPTRSLTSSSCLCSAPPASLAAWRTE